MKLTELARQLGLAQPTQDIEITDVAPLQEAGGTDLSFINERKWLDGVSAHAYQAAAFMVPKELAPLLGDRPHLITPTPALHVAQAATLLGRKTLTVRGIHPTASIDPTAQLGPGVAVGPHAVIEAEVVIGAETVIHAGAIIHERCLIGARCIIGSNSVIGFDGFGYEFTAGRHQKILHLGIVQLEDEVEVGANTTIDRGRFGATRIGTGTKIDNQVQIAHNVDIGRHCLIVAQVGIAGSCRIEDGVVLAGQAGLVPHVTIGRGARVAASTGVAGSVPAGITWSGYWGQPHRDNLAQLAAVRGLPAFMKKVQAFMKKWEERGE
ncbi:MAG: UDP-3-O-(3-hydroxymyristoyl)glucosamine N-acyltransferase [Magnetococcales bacterium]|nr:UDP-3-O-(3-hydroxymyristoyl)glucosamine N-acyltransferase [Magnetococcales bacterium]